MIFNNKYEKKKLIGKGSLGAVYKVEDIKTNNIDALKFITSVKNNEFQKLEKEIEIMKKLKNNYIIELKDNFYDKTNKGYCILMELCNGNLRDILNKYKPKGLPLNIINKIFFQLNDALKTMIYYDYTHRNLKPENILIKFIDNNQNNFDIKLTDFGLSVNNINSTNLEYSKVETQNYMAPEIETFMYNNKCDLWSLGVILYELYTNQYIFYSDIPKEKNDNRYKGKIVKEQITKILIN